MKLLIRNLARTTTEASLITLFKNCGTVQSCNLVFDKETGESKGFGFIEMPKLGEAKIAMKSLNGLTLDGQRIRVKKAGSTSPKEDENVEKEQEKKKDTKKNVWGK